jgi:hypothetical protein
VVRKLAALVRGADALDRRRRQAVRGLSVDIDEETLRVHLEATGDVEPEMEAFREKAALLGTLLDRRIEVTVV